MGIMFGGVTDEDKHEESLESVFHNDLYGYQTSGNERWVSVLLKKPKQEKGRKRRWPRRYWLSRRRRGNKATTNRAMAMTRWVVVLWCIVLTD